MRVDGTGKAAGRAIVTIDDLDDAAVTKLLDRSRTHLQTPSADAPRAFVTAPDLSVLVLTDPCRLQRGVSPAGRLGC